MDVARRLALILAERDDTNNSANEFGPTIPEQSYSSSSL